MISKEALVNLILRGVVSGIKLIAYSDESVLEEDFLQYYALRTMIQEASEKYPDMQVSFLKHMHIGCAIVF